MAEDRCSPYIHEQAHTHTCTHAYTHVHPLKYLPGFLGSAGHPQRLTLIERVLGLSGRCAIIRQSSSLQSPFLNDTVRKIPGSRRSSESRETHWQRSGVERAASSHSLRGGHALSGKRLWAPAPGPEIVTADCRH